MKKNTFLVVLISCSIATSESINSMIPEGLSQEHLRIIEAYARVHEPQKNAVLGFLKEAGDDFLKDKIVADIGCGPGDITIEMAKSARYVYGIDNGQGVINYAHKLLNTDTSINNVEFIKRSAEQISWDNEIDVITSFYCIQSIKDKRTVFENFHKALKPGGNVLCTVVTTGEDWIVMDVANVMFEALKKKYPDLKNKTLEELTRQYPIGKAELADMLTGCGFTSITITPHIIPVTFKNREEFRARQRSIFMNISAVRYIPAQDIEYWFTMFVDSLWEKLKKDEQGGCVYSLPTTLVELEKGFVGFVPITFCSSCGQWAFCQNCQQSCQK